MIKNEKIVIICTLLLILAFIIPIACTSANTEGSKTSVSSHEASATAWDWSTTEVISKGAVGDDFQHPDITIDPEGSIHVVFYNDTGVDHNILYRCWDSSSKNWLPIETVAMDPAKAPVDPVLAIDSEGNIHVVWDEVSPNAIRYRQKTKNTGLWGSVEHVSTDSTSYIQRPAIGVDHQGNVHVTWEDRTDYLGSGAADYDIFYNKRNKATGTWLTTEVVSTISSANSWSPSMAIDQNNNVHVMWADSEDHNGAGGDLDIFYRKWDSQQTTWTSTTQVISTESTSNANCPKVIVDYQGDMHIVWSDTTDLYGEGGDTDIFYKCGHSTDNSWTVTKVISSGIGAESTNPDLTVDSQGNVHVVWQDSLDTDGEGDIDIFYKMWNHTTSKWSSHMTLSTVSSEFSYYPEIIATKNDYLHLVWQDRSDYDGAGVDWDIFYQKLVGKPNTPVLDTIDPNPDPDGNITLTWSQTYGASNYSVYRDKSVISSVNELSPIANLTQTDTSYTDHLRSDGEYFYVVIATNDNGDGSLSNCESVKVTIIRGSDLENLLNNPLSLIMVGILVLQFLIIIITFVKKR